MNYNEMWKWKPLLRVHLIHHKAHHKENNTEQTQTSSKSHMANSNNTLTHLNKSSNQIKQEKHQTSIFNYRNFKALQQQFLSQQQHHLCQPSFFVELHGA